jgi:uncharacterized protein YjbJ (UPF0337 family)
VFERLRLSNTSIFFALGSLNNLYPTGVAIVGGKTDEVKGRIKEAVGAVTDNDKMRAEGQTDQAVGKVKQVAEQTVDKVTQAVKKLRD